MKFNLIASTAALLLKGVSATSVHDIITVPAEASAEGRFGDITVAETVFGDATFLPRSGENAGAETIPAEGFAERQFRDNSITETIPAEDSYLPRSRENTIAETIPAEAFAEGRFGDNTLAETIPAEALARSGENTIAETIPAEAFAEGRFGDHTLAETIPAEALARFGENTIAETIPAEAFAEGRFGDNTLAETIPAEALARSGENTIAETIPAEAFFLPRSGDNTILAEASSLPRSGVNTNAETIPAEAFEGRFEDNTIAETIPAEAFAVGRSGDNTIAETIPAEAAAGAGSAYDVPPLGCYGAEIHGYSDDAVGSRVQVGTLIKGVPTALACQQSCAATEGCYWFVWRVRDGGANERGNCLLKTKEMVLNAIAIRPLTDEKWDTDFCHPLMETVCNMEGHTCERCREDNGELTERCISFSTEHLSGPAQGCSSHRVCNQISPSFLTGGNPVTTLH